MGSATVIETETGNGSNGMNVSAEEILANYPKWNGEAAVNYPYAYDGYWRSPVLSQLMSGIVDIPFLIIGLPAILTLYRLDKVMKPMLPGNPMNQGKWFARFNIIFQSWRVFIDLICLPF